MKREEALTLVKKARDDKLIKHMLAVEAIMKETAEYLSEDTNTYSTTGLIHDIDYEETKDNPEKHGLVSESILKGKVVEEVIQAIKEHNYENLNLTPKSKLGRILIAADTISGLIIAAALMRDKKLENVNLESLKKSFKKKDFARNCNRKNIVIIEEFMSLEKFFEISLKAMKSISSKLGL